MCSIFKIQLKKNQIVYVIHLNYYCHVNKKCTQEEVEGYCSFKLIGYSCLDLKAKNALKYLINMKINLKSKSCIFTINVVSRNKFQNFIDNDYWK